MTQCCNQDCNQGRTCPLRTGKAQDQQARIVQLEALLKFADERINMLLNQVAAAPLVGQQELFCIDRGTLEDVFSDARSIHQDPVSADELLGYLNVCFREHEHKATHPTQQGLADAAVLTQVRKAVMQVRREMVAHQRSADLECPSHTAGQLFGVDMARAAISRVEATIQPTQQGLEQAVAAERERICAAIKTEDDHCVDQGDYMLDSNDCIKIVRGEWVRPDFAVDAAQAKQGGT